MGKIETAAYMSGVLFSLAVLRNCGTESEAAQIVSEIGGLKELRKGICAEQDVDTLKWLKGFCK